MTRLAVVLGLAVGLVWGAWAAETPAFGPDDFKQLDRLEGKGWTLTRYGDDIEGWGARLESAGKVVHEIAGADRDILVKYLLWPDEANPTLLFVLRGTTGSHSPTLIDAVQLEAPFLRVLRTDLNQGFSFERIEDLNADGRPEVLGGSLHYECLHHFPVSIACADSPKPPRVVMEFDENRGYYRPASYRYAERVTAPAKDARQAFEQVWGGKGLVPAEVVLEGWPTDSEAPAEAKEAYLKLFEWALHTLYAGRPEEAWAILAEHAEPVLAKVTRQYLERESQGDYSYYDMNSWKNESEDGKDKS